MLAEAARRQEGTSSWQERARRELHTWKGVLSQFHLWAAARAIHLIEDELSLTPAHLTSCRAALDRLLALNASVWRLDLDGQAGETRISTDPLQELKRVVDAHAPADQLRAAAARFFEAISERSFHDALGPMEEAVAHLGAIHRKTVTLVLGPDVKLPARLAPAADLLIHLVRNAVAHGIEAPGARGSKPDRGTIRIDAVRDRAAMIIEVSDDGAGLPIERIVPRAVERGLISAENAFALSEDEQINLIFRDGLSTNDVVDQTSGRGVGLSAVADGIRKLGGAVRVSSRCGQGTTFRLTLPLAS